MCRELTSLGVQEPTYHLDAFILKACVYAKKLEGSTDAARKDSPKNDEGHENTTRKNYPENQESTKKEDDMNSGTGNTTQKILPRKTTREINTTQKTILDYIMSNPKASRLEMAGAINGVTEDGIKYNLKVLQQKGLLKRIGPDKGGRWEVTDQAQAQADEET